MITNIYNSDNYHKPVMLEESVRYLINNTEGIFVDGTFGGGGHTNAILSTFPKVKVIAFDQDSDAEKKSLELSSLYPDRFHFVNSNFKNLMTEISLLKIPYISGILYDLGVSSHQINTPSRGFGFQSDALLDMRMSHSTAISAIDVVNYKECDELSEIFFKYGEERFSRKIAKAIIREREKSKINTTFQLSSIIADSVPNKSEIKSKARVFQALRIFVNDEMTALQESLNSAIELLEEGGRIVTISYHSLEDRICKTFFKEQSKDCNCPHQFLHCICNAKKKLNIITRKPICPTSKEIKLNNRSRSAKLRVAEKVRV